MLLLPTLFMTTHQQSNDNAFLCSDNHYQHSPTSEDFNCDQFKISLTAPGTVLQDCQHNVAEVERWQAEKKISFLAQITVTFDSCS